MKNDIQNNINEALFNFYLEADRDIINDSLEKNISNLEEYNKKKKKIIFFTKAKTKQQQNDHLKDLANKFKEAINQNTEKPIAILKQIIQCNPSFALYHNLDKLSKEDIIEIIKDKNIVELLEELDKNDQNH